MNKSSAFNASEFCHTLQSDSKGRAKSISVPGHKGKSYRVILRRESLLGSITAECSLTTSNGDKPCKGNSHSICYHSLAALIHAADCAGCEISLCESEKSAMLLKNIGGDVIKAASYTSGKSVWLVVNLPESQRARELDDEWQLEQMKAARDEETWYQGIQ